MPVLGGNAIDHGKAHAGLLADDQTKNIISGLVKNSNIPFGSGVVRGANAGEVTAATAASTADQFVGVAVYELNRAYNAGEVFGAVEDMDASLLTMGVIWVQVAAAVTAGQTAYMGVGANVVGKWSNAAGAGDTLAVEIGGAKFLDTAAVDGLARLSIVVGG